MLLKLNGREARLAGFLDNVKITSLTRSIWDSLLPESMGRTTQKKLRIEMLLGAEIV